MAQIFAPWWNKLPIVAALVAGLAPVVATAGVWYYFSPWYTDVGYRPVQPVPYSHKLHVGELGLDCRYCHTTVETSAHAGLPSTGVCLGCHSQLFRDQPLLAPLHESAASDVPIPWRRVYELPDFVFFEHSVHVAKGVACVECHGRVDQMPLTWRAQRLEMQWCLDCHRDPAPHLRPRDEVFRMDTPEPSPAQAGALARAAHLESTRRLTDCSTCHR